MEALHQTRIEVHPRWSVRGKLERAREQEPLCGPGDLEIRRFPHAVLLRFKMCGLTRWGGQLAPGSVEGQSHGRCDRDVSGAEGGVQSRKAATERVVRAGSS
jgi:hypothetical protein